MMEELGHHQRNQNAVVQPLLTGLFLFNNRGLTHQRLTDRAFVVKIKLKQAYLSTLDYDSQIMLNLNNSTSLTCLSLIILIFFFHMNEVGFQISYLYSITSV